MNKGVIIEVKKDYSIAMADGEFFRLINKGEMEEGQKVMFTDEDVFVKKPVVAMRTIYTFASIVASFLLVLILAYQMNVNDNAYGVVTIDINPSMELTIDKENKVMKEKPLNEDAKKLGDMKLKGLGIENAVEVIVAKAEEKGFIDKDSDAYVLVTTIPLKENKYQIGKEVKSVIIEKEKSSKVLQSVNIATTETTKEVHDEAVANNVPVGLYKMKDKVNIEKYSTVKEFFKEKQNIELFKEAGDIIESEKIKEAKKELEELQEKANEILEKINDIKESNKDKIKDKANDKANDKVKEEKVKEKKTDKIKDVESAINDRIRKVDEVIPAIEIEGNVNINNGGVKVDISTEISDKIKDNKENITNKINEDIIGKHTDVKDKVEKVIDETIDVADSLIDEVDTKIKNTSEEDVVNKIKEILKNNKDKSE